MKSTDPPVIVEQTFDSTPEQVWRAITELDQMTQWFFENIPDFKPKLNFETRFIVDSGDRLFPHIWKITEVIPLQKITYNWKYEGYEGDSFVTFQLTETGGKTKIRLTCDVVESFSDAIPEFRRESCIAGWNYFIGRNLTEFLEK